MNTLNEIPAPSKVIDLLNRHVIEPLDLVDMKEGFCIAGGCLTRAFSGSKLFDSDVDIFPASEEYYGKIINKLMLNTELQYNNEQVTRFTIKGPFPINIDLVKSPIGSPEHILKNFDFTIAMAALQGDKLLVDPRFLLDLSARNLHLNKEGASKNPLKLLLRLMKYTKRGFNIDEENLRSLYSIVNTAKSHTHYYISSTSCLSP